MRHFLIPTSLAVTMLTATPALAHTETVGLGSSFFSGLLHPLTGVDHLLAMIAFGIWFAFQSKEDKFSLPTTVLSMLVAGFAIGLAGFSLPFIEGGILTSLLVLGLLIAFATKLKATFSHPLVAGFALFHGFAHGAEIGSASAVLFMLGFILTCALLITFASKSSPYIQAKSPLVTKLIGLMVTVSGLSFMAV